MLYLDSSALVKLVIRERESDELRRVFEGSDANASSVVAAIEVPRAIARATDDAAARRLADELLSTLDLRRLDDDVVAAARSVPRELRSLDAIHVGTARTLRSDLEAIVAYDRRLRRAAEEMGLAVISPGA